MAGHSTQAYRILTFCVQTDFKYPEFKKIIINHRFLKNFLADSFLVRLQMHVYIGKESYRYRERRTSSLKEGPPVVKLKPFKLTKLAFWM